MSAAQTIPLVPAEIAERDRRRRDSGVPELWAALDSVMDPEIPVISIGELGVLQNIELRGDAAVVTITPTYSGCPAMRQIAEDIEAAMARAGYPDCEVVTQLAPAWSSTWIDAAAQEKLRVYGIAPPGTGSADVCCPHCGSELVRRVSEFGSTACKALYQCEDCSEPFDYFKSF